MPELSVGCEILPDSVVEGEVAVKLCFQRVSKDAAKRWNAFQLEVGHTCDAKDSIGTWLVGQVIDMDESSVKIHYKGRHTSSDETILRASARLAQLGTHTKGREIGTVNAIQQGQLIDLSTDELMDMSEKLKAASLPAVPPPGTPANVAFESFWQKDLYSFIEKILSSAFRDPSVVPAVNRFIRQVLEEIVNQINIGHVNYPMIQMLNRLFGYDCRICAWYYKNYGFGHLPEDSALDSTRDFILDRQFCSLPTRASGLELSKFFVTNVNVFGTAGGFDAVLGRFTTEDRNTSTSLQYLHEYTWFISKSCEYLNLSFTRVYVPQFQNAFYSRLLNFKPEDFKDMAEGYKERVETMWKEMRVLLCSHYGKPNQLKYEEQQERFQLNFGKQLLLSSLLNMRIRGISHLADYLEKANLRDIRRKGGVVNVNMSGGMSGDIMETVWLGVHDFCLWCIDNEIIEICLGDPDVMKKYGIESPHIEVIKRVDTILIASAKKLIFTENHMNILWRLVSNVNVSSGSQLSIGDGKMVSSCDSDLVGDEAMNRAVFSVVASLSVHLDSQLLDQLGTRITALPLPLQATHIDLIRVVIREALPNEALEKDAVHFGMGLLWESCCIEDEVYGGQSEGTADCITIAEEGRADVGDPGLYGTRCLAEEAAIISSRAIASIFFHTEMVKLFDCYLFKCVNHIKSKRCTTSMIRLLHMMINSQHENFNQKRANAHITKQTSINFLQDNFFLTGVLVNELGDCVRATASTGVLKSSRAEAIKTRMDFLRFTLENSDSKYKLTSQQVVGILACFTATRSVALMDSFLQWIAKLCPVEVFADRAERTHKCLDDNALKDVFDSLLKGTSRDSGEGGACTSQKDARALLIGMSSEGYLAIEKLFRFQNLKMRALTFVSYNNFVVESHNIYGMDELYELYLDVHSPTVAEEISMFLVSIFTKTSETVDKRVLWTHFAAQCMSVVHKAFPVVPASTRAVTAARDIQLSTGNFGGHSMTSNLSDQSASDTRMSQAQRASRAISILAKFITEINKPPTFFYSKHSKEFLVKIYWKREGDAVENSCSYYFTRRTVTIGSFRARIAQQFNTSSSRVQLLQKRHDPISTSFDSRLLESADDILDVILYKRPIADAATVIYKPAITVNEDPNSDQMAPRVFLSNTQEHLEVLFNLLSIGARHRDETNPAVPSVDGNESIDIDSTTGTVVYVKLAEEAWHLLELLPTNKEVYSAVNTLGGVIRSFSSVTDSEIEAIVPSRVDWISVLDGEISLLLLYKMRIIVDILRPLSDAFATDAEKQRAKYWVCTFVRSDGVYHLLDLAIGQTRSTTRVGQLERLCITELYKVVRLFLPGFSVSEVSGHPASDPDSEGEDEEDENRPLAGDMVKASLDLQAMQLVSATTLSASLLLQRYPVQKVTSSILTFLLETLKDDSNGGRTLDQVAVIATNSADAIRLKRKLQRRNRYEQFFKKTNANNVVGGTADDRAITDESSDSLTLSLTIKETLATANLVNHAFSLLLAVAAEDFSVLEEILQFENFVDLIRGLLLHATPVLLRKTMSDCILKFCDIASKCPENESAWSKPSQVFSILLNLLPDVQQIPAQQCTEYFELMCQLCDGFSALKDVDLMTTAVLLTDAILERPIIEESPDDTDWLFRGLMSLLRSLFSTSGKGKTEVEVKSYIGQSKGLIKVLFEDCLFAVPSRDNRHQRLVPPKCKSSDSRHRAYLLLNKLCSNCPENSAAMLAFIKPHHNLADGDSEKKLVALRQSRFHGVKSKTGYVGLNNPGCVCYLNSSLQQFFMVPAFRKGILEVEIFLEKNEDPRDNFLYQLQQLFANLQESEKASFSPADFCYSFKDYDGQSTDVTIQQDASEFLTNFFQKVENDTMGTNQENLLKESFGGSFSNELLAAGGKYSERTEPFYFISVSVAGKSLAEGLRSFIQGENVDYTWEVPSADPGSATVKESLPTNKRVSVLSLPNHLIIHLKRFEFDFETMMQKKLNKRFQFPVDLNMYAYTKYGREDAIPSPGTSPSGGSSSDGESTIKEARLTPEDCNYRLAGIVIHMGTANSGHYYSFIKERNEFVLGDGQSAKTTPTKWFEFNDTFVTDFDVEDIDDEAFGGEENMPNQNGLGSRMVAKTRNAFMIVYDKINTPLEETESVSPASIPVSGGGSFDRSQVIDSTLSVTEVPLASKYRAPLSEELLARIWEDNVSYWNAKNIHDEKYLKFTSMFLIADKSALGVQRVAPGDYDPFNNVSVTPTLDCAIKFTLGTVVQARDLDTLKKWTKRLLTALTLSLQRAEAFLTFLIYGTYISPSDADAAAVNSQLSPLLSLRLLGDLTYGIDDQNLRVAVFSLISGVFTHVLFNATETGRALVLRFIDTLGSHMRQAQIHRKIDTYFDLFRVFARSGKQNCAYLLDKQYLARMLSFYLGEFSPYPDLVDDSVSDPVDPRTRTILEPSMFHWMMTPLVDTVSILLQYVSLGEEPGTDESSAIREASKIEKELMYNEKFINRLFRLLNVPRLKTVVGPIIQKIVRNSKELSDRTIDIILGLYQEEDGNLVKMPFRAAMILFSVEDRFSDSRVTGLMIPMLNMMYKFHRYVNSTDISVMMLLRLAKKYTRVAGFLRNNWKSYSYKWLVEYCSIRNELKVPQDGVPTKPRTKQQAVRAGVNSHVHIINSGFDVFDGQLRRVFAGEPMDFSYDSDDDPDSLLGRRLKIRHSDKWFEGRIEQFDDVSERHEIIYDGGGERKYYKLNEINYRFI